MPPTESKTKVLIYMRESTAKAHSKRKNQNTEQHLHVQSRRRSTDSDGHSLGLCNMTTNPMMVRVPELCKTSVRVTTHIEAIDILIPTYTTM